MYFINVDKFSLWRINVSVQLPQLKKSGAKISNWEVIHIMEMDLADFNAFNLRWWRRSRRWHDRTHFLSSKFPNPPSNSSGKHSQVDVQEEQTFVSGLSARLRITAAWSMSWPSWTWRLWSCRAFRWIPVHWWKLPSGGLFSVRIKHYLCRRPLKWEPLRPRCPFLPGGT